MPNARHVGREHDGEDSSRRARSQATHRNPRDAEHQQKRGCPGCFGRGG
ncbi:MAG TPA: hypothetical protein VLJ61_06770 [Pyrinomonadaceae bacterium]|nr:hypothetical protein [Pyrinomonadaceae bacterium]